MDIIAGYQNVYDDLKQLMMYGGDKVDIDRFKRTLYMLRNDFNELKTKYTVDGDLIGKVEILINNGDRAIRDKNVTENLQNKIKECSKFINKEIARLKRKTKDEVSEDVIITQVQAIRELVQDLDGKWRVLMAILKKSDKKLEDKKNDVMNKANLAINNRTPSDELIGELGIVIKLLDKRIEKEKKKPFVLKRDPKKEEAIAYVPRKGKLKRRIRKEPPKKLTLKQLIEEIHTLNEEIANIQRDLDKCHDEIENQSTITYHFESRPNFITKSPWAKFCKGATITQTSGSSFPLFIAYKLLTNSKDFINNIFAKQYEECNPALLADINKHLEKYKEEEPKPNNILVSIKDMHNYDKNCNLAEYMMYSIGPFMGKQSLFNKGHRTQVYRIYSGMIDKIIRHNNTDDNNKINCLRVTFLSTFAPKIEDKKAYITDLIKLSIHGIMERVTKDDNKHLKTLLFPHSPVKGSLTEKEYQDLIKQEMDKWYESDKPPRLSKDVWEGRK